MKTSLLLLWQKEDDEEEFLLILFSNYNSPRMATMATVRTAETMTMIIPSRMNSKDDHSYQSELPTIQMKLRDQQEDDHSYQ